MFWIYLIIGLGLAAFVYRLYAKKRPLQPEVEEDDPGWPQYSSVPVSETRSTIAYDNPSGPVFRQLRIHPNLRRHFYIDTEHHALCYVNGRYEVLPDDLEIYFAMDGTDLPPGMILDDSGKPVVLPPDIDNNLSGVCLTDYVDNWEPQQNNIDDRTPQPIGDPMIPYSSQTTQDPVDMPNSDDVVPYPSYFMEPTLEPVGVVSDNDSVSSSGYDSSYDTSGSSGSDSYDASDACDSDDN